MLKPLQIFLLFFFLTSAFGTFSKEDLKELCTSAGTLPTIQLDGKGKALAVWMEGKTPFFSTFENSWSFAQSIPLPLIENKVPSIYAKEEQSFSLARNAKGEAFIVFLVTKEEKNYYLPLFYANNQWIPSSPIEVQSFAIPKVAINENGIASIFGDREFYTLDITTLSLCIKEETSDFLLEKTKLLSFSPNCHLTGWLHPSSCIELTLFEEGKHTFSNSLFSDFQEEEEYDLAISPNNKILAIRATPKPSLEFLFLDDLKTPSWNESSMIPHTDRGGKISFPLAMVSEKDTAVVTWLLHGKNVQKFMAAFYDPSRGWSLPTNLSSAKVIKNIQLLKAPNNKALLLWEANKVPHLAEIIFPEPAPIEANQTSVNLLGAAAPPSVSAKQVVRRYPGYGDLVNILTFSVSDPSSAASFKIYRDSASNLIKQTSEYTFEDHQRPKDRSTTYYVTCVNTSGTESSATVVSIAPFEKGCVESITGNSGGQVRIDPSRNINIRGSSGQISVTGDPATNTLTLGLAGGGTAIDSLTPDPGTTPVFPDGSGDVRLEGGTNITTAGSTNTVTFNLDSDVELDNLTANTSVATPTVTGSATTLTLEAVTGQDIIMQLGDAAGSNKVSFVDTSPAEVASMNSDGTLATLEYTAQGANPVQITAPASQNIVVKMGDAAGANGVSFIDSGEVETADLDSNGNLSVTTATATTSVTSPTYTSSGADTNITAASNQNIVMKMGDAAASNKVSFTDSADAEVASLDSDGTLSSVEYTSVGANSVLVSAPASQDVVVKMGDAAGSNKISFTDSADAEVVSIDSEGVSIFTNYINYGAPRYALLKDEKPSGTSGGDFNSGAWRTRDLNTEIDPDGIVTLNTSTSQFTLETGTYYVWISCPAFSVRSHQAKLVSDPSGTPSDALIGSSAFTRDGTVSGVPIGMQSFSVILGIIPPSISTTYEVQHQCGATKTGNGFGVNTDFGVSQIYTQVFIQKLSD